MVIRAEGGLGSQSYMSGLEIYGPLVGCNTQLRGACRHVQASWNGVRIDSLFRGARVCGQRIELVAEGLVAKRVGSSLSDMLVGQVCSRASEYKGKLLDGSKNVVVMVRHWTSESEGRSLVCEQIQVWILSSLPCHT